jgi:hypothetical protein
LRATQTLNRRSPRMVKRRNSPYKSHDRGANTRVLMDCTPHAAPPMAAAAAVAARGAPAAKPTNAWEGMRPYGEKIV